MNKKFFSALLMGSLLLGGTFVSCSDYDDDIKNLQEQIDQLASKADVEARLSQLQSALTAAQSTATEALAAAKAADNSADIKKLEAKIAEIEKAQAAVDAAIAAVQKEVADQLADFEKKTQEAILAAEKKTEDAIGKVATQLKSLVFQPEFYLDGIEAAEYTYLKYAALSAKGDGHVGNQKNNLGNKVAIDTAFVWQYRHAGNILNPVEPTVNAKTGKVGEGDKFVPAVATKPFTIVGTEDSLKFALNPVDAEVKAEDLELVFKNVNIQTRAEEVAPATITRINKADGILTVYYEVTDPVALFITANNAEQEGYTLDKTPNTTTVELRAYNDVALINSDFAAIYENLVKPVAIALNAKATGEGWTASDLCEDVEKSPELYKNPYEALLAGPTGSIAYNGSGINLSEYINIHMVMVDEENTKEATDHYAITLAQAEARYGLTTEFKLVPYVTESEGNLTNPSNYVSLNGDKVKAGTVNAADGSHNPAQGPSSVDKQPLVQVLVKRGNDVVLDGYIKLVIAREVGNKTAPVFDLGRKDWSCEGLEFAQTWAQVSDLLLEQTVKMSKEEFFSIYKPVVYTEHTSALQQYALKDGEYTEIEWKDTYTEVEQKVDKKGTTNTVLAMTLDTYAQQYVYEKPNHTDVIYVKYVRKASETVNEGVFVPLQIALNEYKVASIEKKNVNYWYAADGTVNTTPDEALRFNVNYPKDKGNTIEFISDINNAWEGNALVVLGADGKKLDPQPETTYYFHPATNNVVVTDEYSGAKYQLKVDYNSVVCHVWTAEQDPTVKDEAERTAPVLAQKYDSISSKANPIAFTQDLEKNHKIYVKQPETMYANTILYAGIQDNDGKVAKWVKIAELDPETGKVTYLHETPDNMSWLVLNAVSHKKAEAKVYVGVYYTDGCDHVAPIAENVFPAFFLRPLDILESGEGEVLDAKANGDVVPVFNLFHFMDWRDVEFMNLEAETDLEKYGNLWLMAYYGVKTIKIDLDKATTDMNGHDFDVTYKDVNKNIKFSYVDNNGAEFANGENTITMKTNSEPKTDADALSIYNGLNQKFGMIKYENNGANVSDFQIKVPVSFGYDWGEITTSVTIKVKGTMANNGTPSGNE